MELRNYDPSNSDCGCACYNMDNSVARNSIFSHLLYIYISNVSARPIMGVENEKLNWPRFVFQQGHE